MALVAGAVFLAVGAIVIESESRQAGTSSGERGDKTVNYLEGDIAEELQSRKGRARRRMAYLGFGLRVGLI